MGGGLMQLVAYGAQDVYLTGNPQITFFKVVYRRHTNFSVEPIEQVFNGSPDFGRTVTATLNRNGDLITNMYSVVTLNDVTCESGVSWGYVRRLGYALIDETKVEIGGSKIDEQYGDWLNVWYELSHKVGQERGVAAMLGDTADLTSFAVEHKGSTLYIPLGYWFNRHNGLALPLIALQYHDVRVTIQYLDAASCVNWDDNSASQSSLVNFGMEQSFLLIDYVYLDSEERKRFAQASHEYLIEQLQFTGSESLTTTNNKYRLNFNHPSKFLIWVPHLEKYATANNFLAYADDGDWAAAKEKAAKLVWLASRDVEPYVDASGNNVWGVLEDATARAPLSARNDLGVLLEQYAGMVDAQFMFTEESGDATIYYPANVDNVVLLRNDLSSPEISSVLGDIVKNGAGADSVAEPFLQSNGNSVLVHDQFNYGRWIDRTANPVASAKLQLNGHDRFQEREGSYFNYVQPYQHFSNTPADGVNVYSFALKPEDHQPSGTCNFSRIDNATLNLSVVDKNDLAADSNLNIYTVNYNVLRVMSGMAGTAYSN